MFPISGGKLPSIPQEYAHKYPTVKFPMDLGSLDNLVPDILKWWHLAWSSEVFVHHGQVEKLPTGGGSTGYLNICF
jgi:hypothetical protein